jgi:hypothetical protein
MFDTFNIFDIIFDINIFNINGVFIIWEEKEED